MWNRPFKLVSEAYYKNITDVNTYTIDNVRIRYRANNNAEAYAYGFDARLNGEFVPGTESWFSFGYLKTEENQDGKGFIARPTDQRLKFGVLFQDYMPNIPNLKLYLNLVYNTGLPGGSPSYVEDSYAYQMRLNDYRRADVGFSYVFKVNPDLRVSRLKVQTGRIVGTQVELLTPLPPETLLVANGAGFLNDGDLVKVVASPSKATASAAQ